MGITKLINSIVPFHMFFSLQIIAAEAMFAVHQPKRSSHRFFVPLCYLLFLVLCFFHPMMGHRYVRVIAIFAESVILQLLCLNISAKCAIFIGIASYAIQNLANQMGNLLIEGIDRFYSGIRQSDWFYFITLLVYLLVYAVCYKTYVQKCPRNGEIYIKSWSNYFLVMLTLATTYVRSIYLTSYGRMEERFFTIISIIMVLALQFNTLKESDEEEKRRHVEAILSSEKGRQAMLQENIDIINMKAHDLRYHIEDYKKQHHLEEHDLFFKEVEKAVNIYDNIAKTGNRTLDALLSDKLLYANANDVQMSFMVDGKALDFMVPSDIYSLFGNAIDNALQSVLTEDKEHRIISILVRNQMMCTLIRISNYCSRMPRMENGMPQTEKDETVHGFGVRSIRYLAEKYKGSFVIDTNDRMFTISILIPLDN